MLWGGLKLILSRFVLDFLVLAIQCYCVFTSCTNDSSSFTNNKNTTTFILFATFILVILTSGVSLTNRWTVTFPFIPLIVLQCFIRPFCDSIMIAQNIIFVLSSILIVFSTLMSLILFPPLQLPEPNGKYNVGIIDLHLPLDVVEVNATTEKKNDKDNSNNSQTKKSDEYVSVRLLYPTNDLCKSKDNVPYLNPLTSIQYCAETMKAGAPPPLRQFGWMLHYWRLIKLERTKYNAKPIKSHNQKQLPIIIFSHGLGGTASMYTYQTMNLASHGNFVCSINHSDGSAPIVERSDGTIMYRNDSEMIQLWLDGKKEEYVRQRRKFTSHRVDEYIGATNAIVNLLKKGLPPTKEQNQQDKQKQPKNNNIAMFKELLDTSDITFMGHSFGGATAITASHRYPNLVTSLIALDPALDWVPDDARRSLLSEDKLRNSIHSYDGGTGGYEEEEDNEKSSENNNNNNSDYDEEEKKDDKQDQQQKQKFNNNNIFLSLFNSRNNSHNNSNNTGSNSISDKNNNTKLLQQRTKTCVHDVDMLMLYSNEWYDAKWGAPQMLECMNKRGELGPSSSSNSSNNKSDFGFISKSKHNEFSDVGMLTPLWLARSVGTTGLRSPIDTANETLQRTLTFLSTIRDE